MPRAYVVTEGQADADLLRRVLADDLVEDVEFVVGRGRSAAESLARSILAVKQTPVALIIDTNTTDERSIDEQVDFLRYYLDQGSGSDAFEVIPAVPEIEAVLFHDRSLVERITKQQFSEREWQMAKRHPKESLTASLSDPPAGVRHALEELTEEDLDALRRHPLVLKLSEFLSPVSSEDRG
jgi:hypothetical protein